MGYLIYVGICGTIFNWFVDGTNTCGLNAIRTGSNVGGNTEMVVTTTGLLDHYLDFNGTEFLYNGVCMVVTIHIEEYGVTLNGTRVGVVCIYFSFRGIF